MTYRPATAPMAHQRAALAAARAAPSDPAPEDVFGYLMEMGTGKSKVVLDEWGAMSTEVPDLLVIAPTGSYRNWFEDKADDDPCELRKHLDPALFEHVLVGSWQTGGGRKHRDSLGRLLSEQQRPRALFVNVEALSTVQAAVDLCMDFASQRLCYVAVDESTRIKGRSRRTKAVLRIGEEAAVRRIMTGLVTPRSPLDLYHQFAFLDWRIIGLRSYRNFVARYAVQKRMTVGGRSFDRVVGYRNVEELSELIAPYSYRVLKRDCLDLPPKVYEPPLEIEQTPEQRRAYREILEYGTTMVAGGHVTTTQVIQQIMRLHQINCGYVVDEGRVLRELPERRTDMLIEILGDHEGKAVVWAPFDYCIRKIVRRLGEEFGPRSVAAFWGGNLRERGAEERRWLSDPECRTMVATPAAGGVGNNWTAADLVVYYANNYDLEHRAQSEDRTHRAGQTRSVTYVDLIARGTVDEKIVRALRRKIDMATLITREGHRAWLI